MNTEAPVLPPEAKDLSTAEISDALDALRLPGSALGIGHIAAASAYSAQPSPSSTSQWTP